MPSSPLPSGLVAKLNIVGPDGALVQKGQPIPSKWAIEFRRSLFESGGSCPPAQLPPNDDPVAAVERAAAVKKGSRTG